MNRLFVVLSVVAFTACSPAVRISKLREPMPQRHETVAISVTKVPECPYVELAQISVRSSAIFVTNQDCIDELKEQAAKLGADAIVAYEESMRTSVRAAGDKVSGDTSGATVSDPVFSGTAIRFTQDDCLQ